MATIITRAGKGSKLAWTELDNNFIGITNELDGYDDRLQVIENIVQLSSDPIASAIITRTTGVSSKDGSLLSAEIDRNFLNMNDRLISLTSRIEAINNLDQEAFLAAMALIAPDIWYRFSETSGSVIADSGSENASATLTNYDLNVSGKYGSGIGTPDPTLGDNFVNLPTQLQVDFTTDFTIGSYAKINTVGTGFSYFFDTDVNGNRYCSIEYSSSGYRLETTASYTPSGSFYRSNFIPGTPGDWILVTSVWIASSRSFKLYFNGAEVTYSTAIPGSGTLRSTVINPKILMASSITPNRWCDEWFYVSRALSDAEIASLVV